MSGSPAHGSSFILPQQISYAAARAGHDIDPHDVPLEPSRGGRPGTPARRPDTPARHTDTPARHPDWISSLPLRLAAGDPAAAARHATRLVEALAPAVDADVLPRGLLGIRLDDPTLVALALELPPGWADRAPGPATQPATTRRATARTPTNPRYAAQLAHSRLCRLAEQPPGERLPPHDVLVRLVDAWRVRDRLAADGRVHHLTDWLAAYGASVLVWTREPRPRDLDHRVVVAARDALADGLRASGATPLERL
ncbi:hypothetical protein [Arsenicicoccus bolidensis]|uniref:hypothetical protein n=1 Tax=Arsenicicoccus bolidensis TaxID=229480 RepID=UPI0003F4EB40|nr:hypothetical protein [Arsenicicoccus bolidensis]